MLPSFTFFRIFVVLSVLASSLSRHRNNVCKTFRGYYSPDNNPDCYYDPDAVLTTPEIITKYAGSVEVHEVITDDGYILTMFRIPPKVVSKGVILLHHPLTTSSRVYFYQGNSSLAMTLWHNDFDVWLPDNRGTTYSSKHINMTTDDAEYWNFSTEEIAVYDVSAEVEVIRQKTNNSKLIFIGHSLGASVGLVYSALKATEAKSYFKVMILMGTPYKVHYEPLSKIAATVLRELVEALQENFHPGNLFQVIPILGRVANPLIRSFPVAGPIVSEVLLATMGYTPNEIDPAFFNFDVFRYVNSFSWKMIMHYLQIGSSKRGMPMYDYGKKNNRKIYGTEIPPLYPAENISVPLLIISSVHDRLTTPKDLDGLFKRLSPEARGYGHWKLSGLNHFDFVTGLHRKEILTDRLLNFLNRI